MQSCAILINSKKKKIIKFPFYVSDVDEGSYHEDVRTILNRIDHYYDNDEKIYSVLEKRLDHLDLEDLGIIYDALLLLKLILFSENKSALAVAFLYEFLDLRDQEIEYIVLSEYEIDEFLNKKKKEGYKILDLEEWIE